MMNRIIFVLASAFFALTVGAQSTPVTKARVAEIRKLYTQAKQDIANAQKKAKEGAPANETVVTATICYLVMDQVSVPLIIIIH